MTNLFETFKQESTILLAPANNTVTLTGDSANIVGTDINIAGDSVNIVGADADHSANAANDVQSVGGSDGNIIKPPTLQFAPAGVHKAMRKLNQWILADGKVPSRISVGKLIPANAHDTANWLSFDDAVGLARAHKCNVGFVFNPAVSKLCGVDVDHCIDSAGFNQIARDLITQFDGRAFIEKSTSGTGLHFYFFDDDAPPIGTNVNIGSSKVEVYSHKRFFVVTGHPVGRLQSDNIQFDGAVNLMLKFMRKADKDVVKTAVKQSQQDGALSDYLARFRAEPKVDDDVVIARIRKSKASHKFSMLFDKGDCSEYGDDHSRADFALVSTLAFFTDNNALQIERIFSQSKLCRDKWAKRSDYRDRTIATAIILNSKLKTNSIRPQFVYEIMKQMLCTPKSRIPIPCAFNYDLIFDFDLELRNILAYNLFSQKIELARIPMWYSKLQRADADRNGSKPTLGYVDGDDAAIQNYIDRTYDLRGDRIFQRVVIERANQNMFHPVQDFFNDLPPWDGTVRAERLFIDNLAADDNEYTRAATVKWLLAAVARVFHTGCKFDYTIVLKGKQGIGKSTLLSMLGGEWFGELDSLQGKDAVENIQGRWIIELTEMQAAKKAENEQIKSFLSRQVDRVRLPYERRARPFPRQCVFAATTNDSEILRDQTGGRRFWFIDSHASDFAVKITDADIPQIWAEVYHIYRLLFADGFDDRKLDLPNNLKSVARELQEANTDGSDLRGFIDAFLNRPIPRYEFWRLLTIEQRSKFCKGYIQYLELDRIASSSGRLPCSLDEIEDNCIESDGKKSLPLDPLGSKSYDNVDRSFIFGDGLRRKVSPIEILNECFDGERSRIVNTRKIADIMRTIDGWQYQRGAVYDPVYGQQATSFVRVADNVKPPIDGAPAVDRVHLSETVDIPF